MIFMSIFILTNLYLQFYEYYKEVKACKFIFIAHFVSLSFSLLIISLKSLFYK